MVSYMAKGIFRRDDIKDLEMGRDIFQNNSGFSLDNLSVITRILTRGRQKFRKKRRCCTAGFEDRERGHKPRNAGCL